MRKMRPFIPHYKQCLRKIVPQLNQLKEKYRRGQITTGQKAQSFSFEFQGLAGRIAFVLSGALYSDPRPKLPRYKFKYSIAHQC